MDNSRQGGNDGTPWYKKKFSRERYLQKGEPRELTEDTLSIEVNNWTALTDDELALWQDAQTAVLAKKKKREFLITEAPPLPQRGWQHIKRIEILHVDKRGFVYEARNGNPDELEKYFWPTVQKLLAYFFSPKLLNPPPVDDL